MCYSHMGAENGNKQANNFASAVRSGFASGEDWEPPSGTVDCEIACGQFSGRRNNKAHSIEWAMMFL